MLGNTSTHNNNNNIKKYCTFAVSFFLFLIPRQNQHCSQSMRLFITLFLIVSLFDVENRFNCINWVFNFSSRSVYGNCGIGRMPLACHRACYSSHLHTKALMALIFVGWRLAINYAQFCRCFCSYKTHTISSYTCSPSSLEVARLYLEHGQIHTKNEENHTTFFSYLIFFLFIVKNSSWIVWAQTTRCERL